MRGGVTRGQSIDDGALVGNRSSWARGSDVGGNDKGFYHSCYVTKLLVALREPNLCPTMLGYYLGTPAML